MSTRAPVAAALCLLTLACTREAAAQAPDTGPFVEGGLVVPYQSGVTGTQSVTYVTAPGGATLGWSVGGGVHLSRFIALHAELASTGTMSAREPSRYGMTFDERRRDRFLTTGVRVALPVSRALQLEPFAGLAFTFATATSRVSYASPAPTRPPDALVTHDLDTAIGPAFGLDARVGSGRFSVVPSFRVLRTRMGGGRYDASPGTPDTELESIYPGGYPAWTLRSGVALRLRF